MSSGEQVDRYQVDGLVGSGGMANVYRVRHVRLGSVHAVKLLRLPTPSVIDRLLREGRAQSSLRHPNIVPVTDVIDVDGAPGLVMEWVEGPNLGELLGAKQLSPSEVDAVARGLFAGIEAAHAAGWVHRDLKPANVLLQPLIDRLVPRITDFGLVKALEGSGPANGPQTRTGAILGTPAYMAPEQLLDSGTVDHRADVWALGVLLYELCANKRPFESTDPRSLLEAYTRPLPDLADHRADLPPEAAEAIAWALRTDLPERAPSVAALAERWSAGAWPTAGWSPSTLALASDLVPAVRADVTLDDSHTLSIGPEPFGPPPPHLTAPPVTAIQSPAHPRSRRWPWGIGLAGIGVFAGFSLWPASTPAPAPVLTMTTVPVVTDDPTAQEQLELAWHAFLQGNDTDALRRLEAASTGTPGSPLPELLRSYVLLRDGQVATSLATSAQAARRFPDDPSAAGQLLRVVAAQQRAGSVDVPELAEHLSAHPDDLLALLMAANHCAMVSAEACHHRIPALLVAAPRAPVAYHVATEAWQALGDRIEAQRTLEAGLAVSPDDPTLLDLLVQDALQHEDYPTARATLRRLQQVDPGSESVKFRRVRLAILEGDAAAFAALRGELTSTSQASDTRLAFFSTAADTLIGLGRTHEAESLYAEARALAEADGDFARAFLLTHAAFGAALERGDRTTALAHLEAAAALAAANPEIPRDQRDRLTRLFLATAAGVALARGDLAAAETGLARLSGAPGVSPDAVETLAREIAVTRGDPDTVAQLGRTLWEGECGRGAFLGDAVLRAGDPTRARPLLEAAVNAGCTLYSSQRSTAVLALVALAEVDRIDGNIGSARAHLERVRALWPDADADHGLVSRWRRTLDALGGTDAD